VTLCTCSFHLFLFYFFGFSHPQQRQPEQFEMQYVKNSFSEERSCISGLSMGKEFVNNGNTAFKTAVEHPMNITSCFGVTETTSVSDRENIKPSSEIVRDSIEPVIGRELVDVQPDTDSWVEQSDGIEEGRMGNQLSVFGTSVTNIEQMNAVESGNFEPAVDTGNERLLSVEACFGMTETSDSDKENTEPSRAKQSDGIEEGRMKLSVFGTVPT
jgi:hypothetical protein